MAVKDGSGPRPAAHTAKRCFLNCLETSFKPCFFLPSARVQGPCRRPQTPWQWRTDRARGRQPILPNDAKRCFLNCLETSFKPCFFLPSARVQGPCRRPQTPWQWRTAPLVASKASSDALPLLAAGVGGYIYIYIYTHMYIYIYISWIQIYVGLHLFIVTLLWGQVPRNTYVGSWGSTEVSWRKPWKRWSHWTASAVAKNELVKGRWLWFSKCDTVRYPWLLPSSMVLWQAILSARSPRFFMSLSQGLFFLFVRKGQLYLIYTPGHLTLNPKKHAVEQKKYFDMRNR